MTERDEHHAAAFRGLPGVDSLLREPALSGAGERVPHDLLVDVVRDTLDSERLRIAEGQPARSRTALALAAAASALALTRTSPRSVINATGVIIHTNLGRAPLSQAALAAICATAGGYSDLELVLLSGERGSRQAHVERLLRALTGAKAGLAVNNNAAAVTLALAAVAKGKEVIVSRGQSVEIGGHFRIPEVLRQSGCRLVEVGTTNRTRLDDYEEAITGRTTALLHVHTSNFRVVGFTESVSVTELAGLGHRRGLIVLDDLGSGALLDTAKYGLAHEPTVQESVEGGADLVCFSGDKLLGGPQAGLVVGRADLVDCLKRHPLARAVRIDKCSLVALSATLVHYALGEAEARIPVWQMIAAGGEEIARRAGVLAGALASAGIEVTVQDGRSTVGGGSLPGETLPTTLVVVRPRARDDGPQTSPTAAAGEAARRLRLGTPPVVARVERGRIVLDPRTVLPGQADALAEAVIRAVNGKAGPPAEADTAI